MGFFDLLKSKKKAAQASSSPIQPVAQPTSQPSPSTAVAHAASPGGVMPRLAQARTCLASKDLAGAMAIYERVLSEAGERADVLVTISGDLGAHGHLQEIIEHIAPRYDAERHGPATGINVLQAYLMQQNPEMAQHVLDILFELDRPELEERLHGFSNAIADQMEALRKGHLAPTIPGAPAAAQAAQAEIPKVSLITISKPIWSYGLESLAGEILPPKGQRLRRVAFAQLAQPKFTGNTLEYMQKPEDELSRLSRAIPLWLSETLFFCPHYAPVAAMAILDSKATGNCFALFGGEWTPENIRQLVDSSNEPIDFVVTGTLTEESGNFELLLRLWEVKKLKERKQFLVRWTAATANAELTQLHSALSTFMELTPYPTGQGLRYPAPVAPLQWFETLGASIGLFLAEKKLLPAERLRAVSEDMEKIAAHAGKSSLDSLAWLSYSRRAAQLGLAAGTELVPELANDPLVEKVARL